MGSDPCDYGETSAKLGSRSNMGEAFGIANYVYSGLRLHAASCMWSPARNIPCTADRKEKRCDNHPPLHLGSRLLMPCLGCSSRLAVETVQEPEDRPASALPHTLSSSPRSSGRRLATVQDKPPKMTATGSMADGTRKSVCKVCQKAFSKAEHLRVEICPVSRHPHQ